MKGASTVWRLGPRIFRKLTGREPRDARRNRLDDDHLRLLVSFALAPNANCIDVGAHEGSFLREVVRVAPLGRHVAYEPLPHLAAKLRKRFPTVDVRQRAASRRSGEAPFQFVQSSPALSGLRRRSYPSDEQIEQITVLLEAIDESLPRDYIPTLIKIDVEGAELEVLEGARETIRRHRPIVAFEHGLGGADHYGTTPTAVYDFFVGLGLRIFDIDGNGPYSRSAFEFMFDRPDLWVFVAHE
jgi:FkbM family methyltransferase